MTATGLPLPQAGEAQHGRPRPRHGLRGAGGASYLLRGDGARPWDELFAPGIWQRTWRNDEGHPQPSTSSTSSTSRLFGLLIAALVALFLAVPAAAQKFPAFTGLVTDAANILPADRKAALEAKLEQLQQQTGRQLVVATVPDLQGYAIDDYGYRLGRTWGVGLKGADNGAILLVAPTERKVRIEVGYKLEPVLTDAFSSVIIQQKIVPAFKAGDMPAGIQAGADALAQQLSLPDDQAKAELAKAAAEFDKTHKRTRKSGSSPIGVVIWIVIILVFIFGASRGGGGGGRRYRRGSDGSNWPIWLWAASEIGRAASNHGDDDRGGGGGFWGGGGGGGGGSDGSWGGGGFTGGGGGGFGGGGASGDW